MRVYGSGASPASSSALGTVKLAGDLGGVDGNGNPSSAATPLVGHITGNGGLVTFENGIGGGIQALFASGGQLLLPYGAGGNGFALVPELALSTDTGTTGYVSNPVIRPDNLQGSGLVATRVEFGSNAFETRLLGSTIRIAGTAAALSIGTGTLAASGLIRVANATTLAAARNSANSADVSLVATDASNNVALGDATNAVRVKLGAATAVQIAMTTPVLELGSGSVAGAGAIRALSAQTIVAARNNANTGDVVALATNSSDNLYLGGTAAGGSLPAQAFVSATSAVTINVSGVPRISIGTSIDLGTSGVPVRIFNGGTVVASTGDMRFASGSTIAAARNAANSADLTVLSTDASDNIKINSGVFIAKGTNALAFFGGTTATKQTVTGSKGANAALTSLMAALAAYGLVTDSTT